MRDSYFDTSVLIHAYDPGSGSCKAARALIAEETADRNDLPVGTALLLGEVFNVLVKAKGKTKPLYTQAEARDAVELLGVRFDLKAVSAAHFRDALRIKKTRFRDWGIWDALHWAVAKNEGCVRLYTLDLPGGLEADEDGRRVLEGVEFVQPF